MCTYHVKQLHDSYYTVWMHFILESDDHLLENITFTAFMYTTVNLWERMFYEILLIMLQNNTSTIYGRCNKLLEKQKKR